MATPTLVPKFQITFNILAGTLTFTDQSTNRGATTYGTPRITHVTSGTIIYDGSGWHATTPTWSTPPIDGTPTAVWTITGITLPTSYNGQYKIEYWTKDGANAAVLTTRYYTLAYTAPVVSIDMTVYCSTSQLTSEDTTDYNIEVSGVQIIPTISRVHTITKPAGSGYTGTLEWTDAGTIASRTIGGGATSVTRLWTRTWQTNIVTSLSYVLSAWSTTAPAVVLTDTVYGDDNTFAQCDATICALASCYHNLRTRWVAAITSNFQYVQDKRDTVIQCIALFDELLWYERCGTDTTTTILALQTLLAGENCDCTTNTDAVSVPIVPWASLTGSGTTASDFVYHFGATDPSDGLGTNGDVYQQTADGDSYLTGDIFTKAGGSWGTPKGNVKGVAGSDASAAAAQKVKVLVHDATDRSTPAGLGITQISYDFQLNNSEFAYENDFIEFEYDVKLAQNQNGKLLTLRFAGDDILTYFTDDLVTADNQRVIVKMKITPISDVRQHIKAQVVRSGNSGDIIGPIVERNHECDLNTTRSVSLYGTNSVASASDVLCDCTLVTLWHRETDLIAPGVPLSTGRGLVSQAFTATEGQTEFTVTLFEPNDYYIPLIDNVVQSQLVVTRNGYVFTYAPGLTAGQVLLIVD